MSREHIQKKGRVHGKKGKKDIGKKLWKGGTNLTKLI